jgi:iron complex outermembrane receptor protein
MFINTRNKTKRLKHAFIAQSIALALACSTSVLAAPQSIDIKGQSLAEALKILGQQTGLQIIYNADLITGKYSPAVQGSYESTEVLQQLLNGSNVTFNLSENTVTLISIDDVSSKNIGTLATAIVQGNDSKDGSAEAGYRVEKTKNMGPLNGKAIIDTPYSMSVLPSSLLENIVAGNVDQIYRISPTIQVKNSLAYGDSGQLVMRGFASKRGLTDGMSTYSKAISTEDIGQVEILTGTSGFMYGAGNVGGRVNYVYKRPTQERLTKLTLGNYGGSQYFVHADLGGQIDDDGVFGYRVNLVKQDGETAIEDNNIDKFLITGAFDWHINDDILAQVLLSHRDYEVDGGVSNSLSFSGPVKAPDSSKAYAPKWARTKNESNILKLDLSWNINEFLTLRSAYLKKKVDAPHTNLVKVGSLNELWAGRLHQNEGSYIQTNYLQINKNREDSGANIFLDANFDAVGMKHNMTLGYSSDKSKLSEEGFAQSMAFFPNINGLSTTPEPDWDLDDGYFKESSNTNMIIADEITLNEQWTTQIGFNYSTLKAKRGNPTDGWKEGSDYDKSALTPTVSISYKPLSNLTSYFTYMEALETGTIVGSDYTNAGEIFDPLVSKQIELGAKYELNESLLLTTSLFRIKKPNDYSIGGDFSSGVLATFVQDGMAVHQGLELGFTGKATENLTLLGGVTLLDAKVDKSKDPDIEGKRPVSQTDKMAKITAEYAISAINGLVVTAGVYYNSSFYIDTKNEQKVDGYTIADMGLRYATSIDNTPVAFRLTVNNITDKDYWMSYSSLGTPRTVAFSMSANF